MKLFRKFTLFIFALAVILLAFLPACTAVVEEPEAQIQGAATAEATRHIEPEVAAESTPTTVPPSPEATTTAELEASLPASEAVTEEPAAETDEPVPVMLDPAAFELSGQYGGSFTAVALEGATAIVGAGPRLLAVDIADPAQPVLMGQSELMPDVVRAVLIEEGIAYVADGRGGLVLVDLSDPTQMRTLGQIADFEGINGPVNSLAVSGDFVFATTYQPRDGLAYLLKIDVSDPTDPQLAETPQMIGFSRVFFQDGILFVVGYDNIKTYDANDITQPLSTYNFQGGSWQPNLLLQDNVSYLSPANFNGLAVLDVADPANLTEIAATGESTILPMGGTLAVTDETLYVTGVFGEFGYCGSVLSIVDISDPVEPQKLGEFDPQNCINSLAVEGNILAAAGRSGLQFYDVESGAEPELLSTFIPENGLMDAQTLALDGRTLYVTSAQGRGAQLNILDASIPDTLTTFGPPLDLEGGSMIDTYIYNLSFIAPVWQDGLRVVGVNDPANPELIGHLASDELKLGDILVSTLLNGYLYLPVAGPSGANVSVVNIRDAAQPMLVNTLNVNAPMILDMTEANNRLYVLTQETETAVVIFDLNEPANPLEVGRLVLPRPSTRIAVVGDTLYAACDNWNCLHLAIIDVSNPAQPVFLQEMEMPLSVIRLKSLNEDLILVSVVGDGVWLLDVSEPGRPVLSGHLPLAGEYYTMAVQGNELALATGEGGVYLVQIP